MTRIRQLALALAGVVVLVVAAAAIVAYRWADRTLAGLPRQMLAQADSGWMTSFTTMNRLPDLSKLELARTSDGDGAALFYTTIAKWRGSSGRTAADSARWTTVAQDSGLDRVVAAARMRGWDACALAMPAGDTTDFYQLKPPPLPVVNTALRGLLARADLRRASRNYAGARADLQALIGIGDQMLDHEPTLTGMTAGMQAVRLALAPLRELPGEADDSGRAREFRTAEAWASYHPSISTNPILLIAVPDSAYKMAQDSTLALGWRRWAVHAFIAGHLGQVRTVLFGFPRAGRDSLARLAANDNRDFTRVVRSALHTVAALNRASIHDRWELARNAMPF